MAALSKLFETGKKVAFEKNQLILSPSKKSDEVYQITNGFIVTYIKSSSGKKRIQTILKKGDIFPLSLASKNMQTHIYAETLSDAEANVIPKEVLLNKINTSHEVSLEVIAVLLMYVTTFSSRLDNLEYETVRKKVINRLLFFANRFGGKKDKHVVLHVPITHKLIAESISSSRENVTRELKLLERKNLISFKNRTFVVLDITLLQKELEEKSR